MSTRTPRFGFNAFGGTVTGSLADDGQKFTLDDRFLLDRLLLALESNNYRGGVAGAPLPQVAPTLAQLADSGTLVSGKTFYYVISFVDQAGLETARSDEVSISTPALLVAPVAPQLVTGTGGTLATGLYYYGITAKRGLEESVLSGAVSATIVAGENAVILTLPPKGVADNLQIWRRGYNELGYTRIGSAIGTTFTDNGSVPPNACACDPGFAPPTSNRGVARYAVQVTLSSTDAALVQQPTVRGWRIYRTETAGAYLSANSLVHEVVEVVDELNPASAHVTTWMDQGDALLAGRPSVSNQSMNLLPFTFDTKAALPDPAGYADYYPIVVAGSLYAKIAGIWAQVGGGGGLSAASIKGPWVAATAYAAGDVVRRADSTFVARRASAGVDPTTVTDVTGAVVGENAATSNGNINAPIAALFTAHAGSVAALSVFIGINATLSGPTTYGIAPGSWTGTYPPPYLASAQTSTVDSEGFAKVTFATALTLTEGGTYFVVSENLGSRASNGAHTSTGLVASVAPQAIYSNGAGQAFSNVLANYFMRFRLYDATFIPAAWATLSAPPAPAPQPLLAVMTDASGVRWRITVGLGGILSTSRTSAAGPPAPPEYLTVTGGS